MLSGIFCSFSILEKITKYYTPLLYILAARWWLSNTKDTLFEADHSFKAQFTGMLCCILSSGEHLQDQLHYTVRSVKSRWSAPVNLICFAPSGEHLHFKLFKSNLNCVNEDTAFGSRPLQYSSTLNSMCQSQAKSLALCLEKYRKHCFLKVPNDLKKKSLNLKVWKSNGAPAMQCNASNAFQEAARCSYREHTTA